MGNEFWAAIAGAIVGSVAGGGISYLLQKLGIEQTKRSEDKAKANALLIKCIRIHTNLHSTKKYLSEAFAKAKEDGFEIWQTFLPFANPPGEIHFDPNEIGMLIGLGDDELVNDMMILDVTHNSQMDASRTLSRERRVLTERLRATAEDEDGRFEGVFTQEELMEVRPLMVGVNDLADDLHTTLAKDEAAASSIVTRLSKLFADKLGQTYKIEIKAHEIEASPSNP